MYRVLYIDDDSELLEVGKLFLELSQDFSVDAFPSPQKVLDTEIIPSYDAIISDYEMPGMDGIRFLKEVRSRYGTIPFILFTGKGREDVVIEALNEGADFYLQKGGDPAPQFAELLHKVRVAVDTRRTAKALQETTGYLNTLIANASTPIIVWGTDRTILRINEAVSLLTGIPVQEAPGKPISLLFPPKDIENALALVDRATAGDSWETVELPVRDIRGEPRHILWNSAPVMDADGNVRAVIAQGMDITGRKKAENALSESEERYRDLVENSADMICTIDLSGVIIAVNQAFLSNMGYAPQDMAGHHIREFFTPDSFKRASEEISQKLRGEKTHSYYEVEGYTKDRRFICCEVHSQLLWKDGQAVAITAVLRDITHRREAEEQLKQTNTRLEEQKKSLESLYRIISVTSQAPDLTSVLRVSLDESLVQLGFDSGGIYLLDPDGTHARIVCSKNLPEDILGKKKTLPAKNPPFDSLFLRGELFTSDRDPLHNPAPVLPDGFATVAGIPLLFRGKVTGALVLASSGSRPVTDQERQVLLLIGQELGSLIARMTIEQEWKNTVQNLEALFHSVDDMVFILDANGCILEVNEAVLERLGYTSQELCKNPVLMVHIPERREEARLIVGEMLAGMTRTCHVPLITKHGVQIEVETRVTRGWWNDQEALIGISRERVRPSRKDADPQGSRELFEGMLNGISDIIGLQLPDHTILWYNQAGYECLGLGPDEVKGKKCFELIGRSSPCEVCATSYALISRKPEVIEKYIPEIGRYMECTSNPILDHAGNVVLVIEQLHDVTERTLTIRALQESEAKYRAIFAAESDAILVIDKETGTINDCNDAVLQMYGYRREEITGRPYPSLSAAPETPDSLYQDLRHGLVSRKHRRKDGTTFPVEIMGAFVTLSERNRVVAAVRDITSRVEAECAQKETEDQLKNLVGSTSDWVWASDREGRYVFSNEIISELLGYSVSEVLSGGFVPGMHPDDKGSWYEKIAACIRAKTGWKKEVVRWMTKSGEVRYFESSASPVLDAAGQVTGFHGIDRDITERRQVEEALRQANRKLGLLGSITRHDILNKTAVILGFLDIAGRKSPDPVMGEYLKKLTSATLAIQSQIEFTRIYQDLGTKEPQWQKITEILPPAHLFSGVTFTAVISSLEVFADLMLEKVFFNLLDNSLRYGGHVDRIWISSHEEGRDLVLCWQDNGVGVLEEEKERIFERGYGKNTGLGLYLSREILAITGMSLSETGVPGRGAVFRIRVPAGNWRVRS